MSGRALGAILLGYAIVAALRIDAPFIYHADGGGAQYGKHAKNFVWHGLGATRGIMLDTTGPRLDAYGRYQDHFYPDHPPLPGLTLAGLFAIFGTHDWVVRLQGHLFALGSLVLFFFLVRKWYGGRTSVPATALLALLPMFAYFSSVTVHQVPTLFFILAGLLAYSHRKWGLLVLFQFLACYSDWPGYYLAVVVFVHLGFVERRWKIAWIFPALNVAIFGIYLLHVYAADPAGLAPMERLWSVFRKRSTPMPVGAYAGSEAREAVLYLTVPILACAAGWTLARLRTREPGDRFVLCLPLLSLDELWLQQICSGHDYYLYYLAPFAAVAAARVMLAIRKPLAAAVFAAIILQSGAVLYHRMTKKLPSETNYRLGKAIREVVPPGDKVLSLVYVMPSITSYYADRRIEYYHPSGYVDVHPTVPWKKVELKEFLRSNPEGYDWVVADKEGALLPVAPVERNGFLFYRLSRP